MNAKKSQIVNKGATLLWNEPWVITQSPKECPKKAKLVEQLLAKGAGHDSRTGTTSRRDGR
jgi:hypothetical protein